MLNVDRLDPRTNQALQAWQLYIRSGMSSAQALKIAANQISSNQIKGAFLSAFKKAKGGSDMEEVIFELRRLLSPIEQNMLIIGAASGRLEESIENIIVYRQRLLLIRRSFQKSLLYPAILIILSPWILGLPDVFQEGPVSTYIFNGVLTSSVFFGGYWGMSVFVRWKALSASPPNWSKQIDRLLSKTPFVGDVVYFRASLEFSLLFATQISAGISILESFKTMGRLISNETYRDACHQMSQSILEGDTLSVASQKTTVWRLDMLQELAHGEKTGRLAETMFKQAERAQERYLELVLLYSKWLSYTLYGLSISYVVKQIAALM